MGAARRSSSTREEPGARGADRARPGQELGDHQVKEHAWLLVVDGCVAVAAGGESVEAHAGTLVHFEPDERHAVSARDGGARLLLLLAPWPGEGHYRGYVALRLRFAARRERVADPLAVLPVHHAVHQVAERQEEEEQHEDLDDELAGVALAGFSR